ncbi:MAG TPA: MraY family glycosyltransferase [Tepidisphaeraceae bacterium]|nr:MraY family glycosyltransferase [Tepidisphaeraceae bacterium]
MLCAILGLLAVSFIVSWLLTRLMVWLSPRIGFVDRPGGRKIHAHPKPLGGGVAIVLSFTLPLIAALLYVHFGQPPANTASIPWHDYFAGARQQTPLAIELLAAVLLLHVLGLIDDVRALGPYSKLFAQLFIASALVVAADLRVLTALDHALGMGRWPSAVLTILWITAVTNAFNFLDNMDGLSSGIAVVCTAAFLIATLSIGQWFVAATLALLLGSAAGFLCHNFPPAAIFMGDSGSLPLGFVLSVATVRATYLEPGVSLANRWWSVFAPVIVLAVPLYDLIVVSVIRMMRGKSPFVGDTNHFSHRLVARGMSRRTAVLCLYLITAATAVAAIILPQVRTTFSAMLLFGQTILILGVVALLEQHPLPPNEKE